MAPTLAYAAMQWITELDAKLLSFLAQQSGEVAVPAVSHGIGVDQAPVSAACAHWAEQGLIALREVTEREIRLGAAGAALNGAQLPDRSVIAALAQASGQSMELSALNQLVAESGKALKWLKQRGWTKQEGKVLILTAQGEIALHQLAADELLLKTLHNCSGALTESELVARGIDVAAALALLQGRTGYIDSRDRKHRWVAITEAGRAKLASGELQARVQVNQLTADLLQTGSWKHVDFRRYDVTAAVDPIYPGKEHPLVSIFAQTRRVFLELGFTEIDSPYVESSFWDFDALFQPQDHPAREMQDTFYVGRPARAQLPEDALVNAIAQTHENGGSTGSIGWRYNWRRDIAERPVLRTHTTAATIRALAQDPKPPRKVFCVGPVFRRETVDYKHLPVFHQVDGVIIDEKASFAALLGTLKAFYRRMGFERFQFRPGFFPYTEPSVEVFVWSESRGDWVEMGGAGVFRPEVTRAFGCTVPVLAWGLGLERLAMFRYQLSSIGELYRARLSWLKQTPLSR